MSFAAVLFDQLAVEVNVLHNLFRKRAAQLHRQDSVAPAELLILQILEQQGAKTVPQIGRLRLTSRQNIQITVNRLKSVGWVELIPNPAHKRSELVRLTMEGQKVLNQASERKDPAVQSLPSDLSELETRAAIDVLRRCRSFLAGDVTAAEAPGSAPDLATTSEPGSNLNLRPMQSPAPLDGPAEGNTSPRIVLENPDESELPVSLL